MAWVTSFCFEAVLIHGLSIRLLPCQPADNAALPLLSLVLVGLINGIIYFLCVWIWQHPIHSTVLDKVGTSECESRCQQGLCCGIIQPIRISNRSYVSKREQCSSVKRVLLPEKGLICVQVCWFLHCILQILTHGTFELMYETIPIVFRWFWMCTFGLSWVFFLKTSEVQKSLCWGVNDFFCYPIVSSKILKSGSSFLALGAQASKTWSDIKGCPHFRCSMRQVVLVPGKGSTCTEWIND